MSSEDIEEDELIELQKKHLCFLSALASGIRGKLLKSSKHNIGNLHNKEGLPKVTTIPKNKTDKVIEISDIDKSEDLSSLTDN